MLKYLAASSDTARGKMDVSLKTLAARVGFAREAAWAAGERLRGRISWLIMTALPRGRGETERTGGERKDRQRRQRGRAKPKRGGAAAPSLSRERGNTLKRKA